jgi:hypothetical protein
MDHSTEHPDNTAVDALPQDVFTQIFIQRQQLATSSHARGTMLLESATLLLENNQDYDHLIGMHGGSKPGKNPNLTQNFEASYQQLFQHYFSKTPLHNKILFRRRFCMSKPIFLKGPTQFKTMTITSFRDQMRINPLVKVMAALQMLAYGGNVDCNNEYLQLSETTSLKCMHCFCNVIVSIYEAQDNLERLLKIGAQRGFPGMLGSLDCMHWEWKNFPLAWAGKFQGKEKVNIFISLYQQNHINLFYFV